MSLRGWSDGENPYELACEPLRATTSSSTPTVALGASLTADHVLRIQLGGVLAGKQLGQGVGGQHVLRLCTRLGGLIYYATEAVA